MLARARLAARPRLVRLCSSTARNPPSLSRFPPKQGLYDPAKELDSCGVGMVAHLKGMPSHEVVRDANTMLVRMAHRGGCGCDPASGDGAGILTGMPDNVAPYCAFYSNVMHEVWRGQIGNQHLRSTQP